jgi:hypothetical protein
MLGNIVIDRKTLIRTALALAGSITTVYSVLLALVESPVGYLATSGLSVGESCDLSSLQTSTITTSGFVTWTIVVERNVTCSYENITLGALVGA